MSVRTHIYIFLNLILPVLIANGGLTTKYGFVRSMVSDCVSYGNEFGFVTLCLLPVNVSVA